MILAFLARAAIAYIYTIYFFFFFFIISWKHDFVMGSEKGCICCTYCIERPSWPGVQK